MVKRRRRRLLTFFIVLRCIRWDCLSVAEKKKVCVNSTVLSDQPAARDGNPISVLIEMTARQRAGGLTVSGDSMPAVSVERIALTRDIYNCGK